MGQEFFIKSQDLETKVRKLLPSQGGLGAGVDLSGSTQIVPIVDLTETAEGSQFRQDLQTAFSHKDLTFNEVNNTTTTIINNTGFFRLFGNINFNTTGAGTGKILLNDGATSKELYVINSNAVSTNQFDFVVFLEAGDSCLADSGSANCKVIVAHRQIADINGELINP